MEINAILLSALGWCSLINLVILLIWWLAWLTAREPIFKLHSRWFSIPRERFDAIHYTLLGVFKLAIIFFNLIPYVVLRIIN